MTGLLQSYYFRLVIITAFSFVLNDWVYADCNNIQGLKSQLKQAPYNMDGWYELSRCYAKQQQWPLAIKAAQEAVDLDPTFAEANYSLAKAYESNQQSYKAIDHYEMALKLDVGKDYYADGLKRLYKKMRLMNLAKSVQNQQN